jgi:predicted RNase H-like nuclease (RuvC/YqgF family)
MTEVERIDYLEGAMKQLVDSVTETSENVNSLSNEMKDFKEEMKDFKDEMKDFKDEMKDFKVFSQTNVAELKNNVKELNKKWGELANKMGTVVEDLIYPNIEHSIKQSFNQEINHSQIRVKKYLKSHNLRGELDVIAFSNDTLYIVESKTTPSNEKIDAFYDFIFSDDFATLFPEYIKYKIVLIFASLTIDVKHQKYLFTKKMFPMMMKGNLMEILVEE